MTLPAPLPEHYELDSPERAAALAALPTSAVVDPPPTPLTAYEQHQACRLAYIAPYRNHPDRVLTAQDYHDAIAAVDPGACNLAGLSRSFSLMVLKIRQEEMPWSWVDQHPILQLMLCQINQITGQHLLMDMDRFSDCEALCRQRASR